MLASSNLYGTSIMRTLVPSLLTYHRLYYSLR